MHKNKFQIAIDGPVGAGKSTVSKALAEKLGIVYVDTGAMYRAVALKSKREGVDWKDNAKVVQIVKKMKIEMRVPKGKELDGRSVTVVVDGEDVSWEIRKGDMGEGASIVSAIPEVREILVEKQRELAGKSSVVMEGRDIATRVLPGATIKIYMDADIDERARRKKEQFEGMGERVSFKAARDEIQSRDNREMTRKVDPLRIADGAWAFDTTDLSINEVVDKIVQKVAEL